MKLRFDRASVLAPAVSMVLVLLLLSTGIVDPIELAVRDTWMRMRSTYAPATNVAAVLIDEQSISAVGRWPWSRNDLARVLNAVHRANPSIVVLDLLLLDGGEDSDDLAREVSLGETILAAAPRDNGSWLKPPDVLRGRAALAHAVLEVDRDGVLRRMATTKQAGGVSFPAIAELASSKVTGRPVRVGKRTTASFWTAPSDVPTLSARDVLAGRGVSQMRGRVVFIGVSAAGLGDRVITPVARDGIVEPGVLVHAAITEDLILGREIREIAPFASALIAGAIVALSLRIRRLGGGSRFAAEAFVLFAPTAIAALGLIAIDIALPAVTLTLTSVACVVVIEMTTIAAVHASAGRVARTMGDSEGEQQSSPEDRVRKLEELATALREKERDDAEARRVLVHELKTPLTSIRGMTQLLTEFDLEASEQAQFKNLVRSESDRLAMMIERLLDLEKLSLRDFSRESIDIDLAELVKERTTLVSAGSGRIVDVAVVPCIVRGDRLLLGRALDNILANAMKFSPAGSAVHVRLTLRDGRAVIDVEDEGPGVSPEDRERIFRRFDRGSNADGREGLGLGLAVVYEVMQWHRGSASVSDGEAMGGARFRLELPATRSGREAA